MTTNPSSASDSISAPAADAFVARCPSRDLLARLGQRWSMLILAAVAPGPLHFSELARRIEGVSRKELTRTLRELERDGLLDRREVAGAPPRVEYAATALTEELLPLVVAFKRWAESNWRAVRGE